MKYLTVEEIIQIHDNLIEKFGGEKGIADKSSIEIRYLSQGCNAII